MILGSRDCTEHVTIPSLNCERKGKKILPQNGNDSHRTCSVSLLPLGISAVALCRAAAVCINLPQWKRDKYTQIMETYANVQADGNGSSKDLHVTGYLTLYPTISKSVKETTVSVYVW
jgi:hypothetical protein